jgi:hypothetical protein
MKKNILIVVLASASALAQVQAAVLNDVPMQGSMAMPMVAYNSGTGGIEVMMPMSVPQLTPLLVSNPSDSFDPGDPWFSAVDPSVGGASFSRRYGFMMDLMTDPLPANTQMWIRKLSGSAELKFYRYASTAPKAFEAIFGTDGTTNALYWNGRMFHPCVTAPPSTNGYTATFEIYLVDTTTGQDVPGSSSGVLTFDFTNVSDGRPALTLAEKVVIAWPAATTTNWVLESAASVNVVTWSTLTNMPMTVDGQSAVVAEKNATQQFFRMKYVP